MTLAFLILFYSSSSLTDSILLEGTIIYCYFIYTNFLLDLEFFLLATFYYTFSNFLILNWFLLSLIFLSNDIFGLVAESPLFRDRDLDLYFYSLTLLRNSPQVNTLFVDFYLSMRVLTIYLESKTLSTNYLLDDFYNFISMAFFGYLRSVLDFHCLYCYNCDFGTRSENRDFFIISISFFYDAKQSSRLS